MCVFFCVVMDFFVLMKISDLNSKTNLVVVVVEKSVCVQYN